MAHALMFYLFAALAIAASLAVILHRNIFKSATFLAGMLFCLAALFVLLDAEFIAVVQVLIYIGAITILIVFAIMLTTKINDEHKEQFNSQKFLAPILALGLLGLILTIVVKIQWTTAEISPVPSDILGLIGTALLSDFIFPFDVVSILLLVALIGATYIAKQEDRKPLVTEVDETGEHGDGKVKHALHAEEVEH
ncbi:NADH-quinone oxidoreductase subunit J [bacterium]|nr:NADH-quinone oxidoreductase subunit J [bacterium]